MTGPHMPVGAGGFAESRGKEQAASSTCLPTRQSQGRDRAASLLCSCTSGGDPALPSVPSASCLLGLEETNSFLGCSAWLCCAAYNRKGDLLPSQQLGTGQRQEPALQRGTKREGAMAVGQD